MVEMTKYAKIIISNSGYIIVYDGAVVAVELYLFKYCIKHVAAIPTRSEDSPKPLYQGPFYWL